MSLYLLKSSWKYIILALIVATATAYLLPTKIEIKEKIVTEVKERVRIDTQITESPDGTKVTVISEARDTDLRQVSEKEQRPPDKLWLISVSASIPDVFTGNPIYTLHVSKKVLWDLSVGLYGRTDKEFGVRLGYSF